MSKPVAIITGAGGGIGRAAAAALARAGYRLALVGRTESTLLQTRQLAAESIVIPADLSDVFAADQIVDQTMRHFGRIDAVINSAGTAPVRTVEQTTAQIWRDVLEINLSAPFHLARAVWPIFRKQGAGVIVNISSMAARDPFPGFVAYGAAKAGLNTLGISLAREGAEIGVKVYTIAPGAVETPLLRTILTPEQLPVEKTLRPDEVAALVVQCVVGEAPCASGEVIWLASPP